MRHTSQDGVTSHVEKDFWKGRHYVVSNRSTVQVESVESGEVELKDGWIITRRGNGYSSDHMTMIHSFHSHDVV